MEEKNKTKWTEEDVKRLQKLDQGKTEKGSLTSIAQKAVAKEKNELDSVKK